MERSFKILVIISAITVIFTVAIFVSPGFYNIRYNKRNRVHDFSSLDENGQVPVNIRARRHSDPSVNWETKTVTIDCGLWYFVACVTTKTYYGEEVMSKCHMTSYRNAMNSAVKLPREMRKANLEIIYYHMEDASVYAVLEFQIEATVALILMVIAVISIMYYLRNGMTKRWVGLTSFLSHLIAGVLLVVISGKGWVFNAESKVIYQGAFGYDMDHVKICFPYCLFLCAVGSLMCFGCAMKILLSMTKRDDSSLQGRVLTKVPGSIFGIPSDKLPYEGLVEFASDSKLEIKGL